MNYEKGNFFQKKFIFTKKKKNGIIDIYQNESIHFEIVKTLISDSYKLTELNKIG
jgi:hypothetical protein